MALTPAQIEQVKTLSRAGVPLGDVARKLGVSWRLVKRHVLPMEPVAPPPTAEDDEPEPDSVAAALMSAELKRRAAIVRQKALDRLLKQAYCAPPPESALREYPVDRRRGRF